LEASYSDFSTYSTLRQTAIQFFLCPSQSLSLNIPLEATQVLLVRRHLLYKLRKTLILSPCILDIPAVNSVKRPISFQIFLKNREIGFWNFGGLCRTCDDISLN